MKTSVLMAVWLEVVPLRTLQNWQPVGSLFELIDANVMDFCGGGLVQDTEGLTKQELLRLRKWSKRWRSMHERIREFYILESHWELEQTKADQVLIDTILWKILDADVWFRPNTSTYMRISERWVRRYGCQPSIELIPNLTAIQVRRNDDSRMQEDVEDRR